MGNFVLGLFLGLIWGWVLTMTYQVYKMTQFRAKNKGLLDEIRSKVKDKVTTTGGLGGRTKEELSSIQDRLREAARIAELQMDLRAQAEMPSKNSLHSRHKNGLVGEVFELEQQKISILRTVLGDGFDPSITIIRDGGAKEDVPLSVYVAQAEEALAATGYVEQPTKAPEGSSDAPRKAGKFMIYSGGKNDDGTTH